jgi:predicted transcriptional regulator of viral defense system
MRYPRFREMFGDYPVFSPEEVRAVDPAFDRRRLNEWQQKGYIRKLIRGYYVFSNRPANELSLFEIANRIYRPSYVSLETALSHYGLIPEAVYAITSVSTRNTRLFTTFMAQFAYRTVRPGLFFGYRLVRYGGRRCLRIASPEKAMLDWLYLNPGIHSKEDFAAMRFNPETFSQRVQSPALFELSEKFANKRLGRRLRLLCKVMENA